MDNKYWSEKAGGSVFISHCHKDLPSVRMIRNRMEEEGFEPICFYLKCLTDESEIDSLIKREIDARDLFVFADSENSRKSSWVRRERAYIESSPNRKSYVVDLDDTDHLSEMSERVMDSLRVFLTSAKCDSETVCIIEQALIKRDLMVYYERDGKNKILEPGELQAAIEDAALHGCAVIFLSEEACEGQSVVFRFDVPLIAEAFREKWLPVVIGNCPDEMLERAINCYLSDKAVRVGREPTPEQISAVVDAVENMLLENSPPQLTVAVSFSICCPVIIAFGYSQDGMFRSFLISSRIALITFWNAFLFLSIGTYLLISLPPKSHSIWDCTYTILPKSMNVKRFFLESKKFLLTFIYINVLCRCAENRKEGCVWNSSYQRRTLPIS